MIDQQGADPPPPPGPESPEPGGAGPPDRPGSSTGLDSNIAGGLAYVLGLVTGIIFLVVEKEDRFVRFHAAQSVAFCLAFLAVWVALGLVSAIVQVIPVLGAIIAGVLFLVSGLVGLGAFILWIVLLVQAFSGREWEVPVIGEQARRVILKEGVAGEG